jgi:hypothetical protein
MNYNELLTHVKRMDKKAHFACMIWQTDDVLQRLEENNEWKDQTREITVEEANQIIEDIDRHKDCTIGITWDTIDIYIDEFFWEKEKSHEKTIQ